ncbi:hypothetical protein CEE35_06105 [Candidatus Aerophobetes bacterium Ae_b3b]|nr:MAG: hypothetical protein CEE35_06105 [Candidatus Aerophobetes bacterium Ae_b3b]
MKKETTFILVGLALIRVGFGVAWRATEKATVKNDDTDASLNLESTLFFLRNLSWLRYLASVKRSTLSTKPVPSSSKKTIPRQSLQKLRPHKKSVVEQREVGSDTFSFAESLKRCLRQDPDVILIGEMRDLETIATAITAAETGHLVLATLHTPDAPGAVDRIILAGINQTQVKPSVRNKDWPQSY